MKAALDNFTCSSIDAELTLFHLWSSTQSPKPVDLIYRMVICFAISPLLPTAPSRVAELDPAFFSKSFQNFKLSSAAIIC